jgi:hypothetical protein
MQDDQVIIQKSQEVHFIPYTSTSLYNCTPHTTHHTHSATKCHPLLDFLPKYDPICRARVGDSFLKITDFVCFPCTVVPLKFKNQIKSISPKFFIMHPVVKIIKTNVLKQHISLLQPFCRFKSILPPPTCASRLYAGK